MSEIEFGTDKWFEALNDSVDFPQKFAFYYDKKQNIISVLKLETKGKIDNIRWNTIKPSPLMFHPEGRTAVIEVAEIESDDHYYQVLKRLRETWC